MCSQILDLKPLPQPRPAPEPEYKPTFSALPLWLSKPIIAGSQDRSRFEDLGISEKLLKNLHKNGFEEAFPVQTRLIPLMISGVQKYDGDICVSAPTGSGKTLGYLLPIIDVLKHSLDTRLRAIIVVPTRELVSQARQVAVTAAAGTGIQVGTAVGTSTISHEQHLLLERDQQYDPSGSNRLHSLAESRFDTGFHESDSLLDDIQSLLPGCTPMFRSKVDILICTPGRLVEHIRSTVGFSLQHLEYLIIDEADKLLDESFQEWVEVILNAEAVSAARNPIDLVLSQTSSLQRRRRLQKVILSATMTRDIGKLAALKLQRPTLVAVANEDDGNTNQDESANPHYSDMITEIIELPKTLSEVAIPVGDGAEKPLYLAQLLGSILGRVDDSQNQSSQEHDILTPRVLVFVNSTEDTMRLRHILLALRPDMSGLLETLTKISSKNGRKILSYFQAGKLKVLLATDRASRGIDFSELTDVISYDMPNKVTDYVHRAGRTARAERPGKCWTLFTDTQARWFWNAIARSEKIHRAQGKVERQRIDISVDESMQIRYNDALDALQTAVLFRR